MVSRLTIPDCQFRWCAIFNSLLFIMGKPQTQCQIKSQIHLAMKESVKAQSNRSLRQKVSKRPSSTCLDNKGWCTMCILWTTDRTRRFNPRNIFSFGKRNEPFMRLLSEHIYLFIYGCHSNVSSQNEIIFKCPFSRSSPWAPHEISSKEIRPHFSG